MPRTGAEVKVFPNLKQLQDYTIENEKFFPREDAYASGLLRFLERFSTRVSEEHHSDEGGEWISIEWVLKLNW